jgi:hypothetical protein
MFDLAINELRRVILCSFGAEVSESDFAALDSIGRKRREIALYDVIFDMSAVRKLDLPAGYAEERSEIPQAFKDRARVYIVPAGEARDLIQRYAKLQAARGFRPPALVDTLDQAMATLGVARSDFRPG